jgi:hypothetical protein
MSIFGKVVKYGVRAGTALASGGASEAYRAATGKADPVTAYGERYVDKADRATGGGADAPAGPTETPEEREARLAREAAHDADMEKARQYRDKVLGEPTPLPRNAPEVGAPAPITAAQAGGPNTVGSTYNPTDSDQDRGQLQQHADYLRSVMAGTAGPSVAELAMRRGNAEAIAQQSALAGTSHGYSGAALRAAGRNAAALSQENVAQTGELRAKEIADARDQYAGLVLGTRAQDISVAGTRSAQDLDAAKANQSAKLQTDLTNAGFSQQAILQMSDQDLKAKLANAGFTLTQEQLDDLRSNAQRDAQLKAQGQVLDAGGAQTRSDQSTVLGEEEIRQKMAEAKARGDAADEAFWGDLLTKLATRGAK